MPESVYLDFSANSDDPILEIDDIEGSHVCSWKNAAFIFLMVFPSFIFATELFLYPFPTQIDAFKFCENIPDLISRTDFKSMKTELFKTENKLASINAEMSLSKLEKESILGYKIAKEMLEEYKTEIQANLNHQKNLWKECINQNLITSLIPIKSKLPIFIQNIICLTILAFFIIFLVFGTVRSFFKSDSRILFNLCFIIQSFFIVFIGILFIFASFYYSEIWNLNSNKFVDSLYFLFL